MRIDPFRPMPPCVDVAALDRVAVGEQHRIALLLGRYRRRVARHYIGPIDEIGDPAKALRLALRAEIAARHVETRERSIALRRDAGLDIEGEGIRHIGEDQPAFRLKLIAVGAERLAIERQRHELQRFAIEMQRSSALGNRRVAANTET